MKNHIHKFNAIKRQDTVFCFAPDFQWNPLVTYIIFGDGSRYIRTILVTETTGKSVHTYQIGDRDKKKVGTYV